MDETKTNHLIQTKKTIQKTRPSDGFSFMTGTIPLPTDCIDTSNPSVITLQSAVFMMVQLEVRQQLPKLIAYLCLVGSYRIPVI